MLKKHNDLLSHLVRKYYEVYFLQSLRYYFIIM